MAVAFYNFSRINTIEIQKTCLTKFSEIMEQNSFIDGIYNKQFENDFAKYVNAKFCLLVANGTDALELSLESLNIGAGDYVGIPGITFHATAEAVLNRGAVPVLIDVDSETGLMDPDSLARVCKTIPLKAIMPVHIYGMPAPIAKLEKIAKAENFFIIEDAAQAHGTKLESGEFVGSGKNLTTFSFYPTKNLGAFGDAGAITTHSSLLKEKLLSLRNHGRSNDGLKFFGRNSRCDHFQAVVLHTKLPYLEEQNTLRKSIASHYIEKFSSIGEAISLPGKNFLNNSSWHLFPILLNNEKCKHDLKNYLDLKQIGTSLFYERSMSEEKPLVDAIGERSNSIQFAKRVLCLPIHPHVSKEEREEVVVRVLEGLKLV